MALQKPKSRIGKPVYCPGCLTVIPLRIDKHDKPYFRCQLCSLTIFMGSDFAQVSFLMLQQVIAKNPARWREAIRQGVTLKTKRDFATRMSKEKALAVV
jgi:hypothetical protein